MRQFYKKYFLENDLCFTKTKLTSIFFFLCLAKIKRLIYFTIQFIFITIHDFIILFNIIHESYCTISIIFYFIYNTFNKKITITIK